MSENWKEKHWEKNYTFWREMRDSVYEHMQRELTAIIFLPHSHHPRIITREF